MVRVFTSSYIIALHLIAYHARAASAEPQTDKAAIEEAEKRIGAKKEE